MVCRVLKLPDELFDLKFLSVLKVDDNKIREIPKSIIKLSRCLTWFSIERNPISFFPGELAKMEVCSDFVSCAYFKYAVMFRVPCVCCLVCSLLWAQTFSVFEITFDVNDMGCRHLRSSTLRRWVWMQISRMPSTQDSKRLSPT